MSVRSVETTAPLWRGFLALCVLALLLLLTALLKDRLSRASRYIVSHVRVDAEGLPAFLRGRAFAIGLSGAVLDRPRSIFDPELVSEAAAHFSGRPWVKRVVGLRRSFPAVLEVRLEVRAPFAVVAVGPARILVGDDDVVLEHDTPEGPPLPEVSVAAPLLRGIPAPGESFRRDDPPRSHVVEALDLLRFLRAHREHEALRELRVDAVALLAQGRARTQGASDLAVRLAGGTEIFWGRAPTVALREVEPSPIRKLENLASVLRHYPGLLGLRRVDLSLDDPEVEPLLP
jgi:hypothetical protein